MDRGEQTLAPQWLKAAGSSTNSDEHNNTGTSARNRLAVSACDHDTPRATSSSSSSSSSSTFRRIASSNGSMGHDKDNYAHSRAYSSFGRSHRDRDRDRDRQREREKDSLLDNGYSDHSDLLVTRRIEKDTLRRSHSMVSGRRAESLPRRPGSDSSNGALSLGNSSGGLSKVSFERDFPSLGAEEKQGGYDIARVPSPGLNTAINSLHISTPAIIGAEGWTSALAEVPSMSHSPQTAGNMVSSALSTSTGLSMAETLAQAPSRARTAPPLSNENERRKELSLLEQYNKLIPVTPAGPKNTILNSSDKLKSKGARNGDPAPPKIGQQSPSLLGNHTHRLPSTRPETLKSSQPGNLLVLNREKNAISLTSVAVVKDGSALPTAHRAATSLAVVPSASSPILKVPANPKLKANGTGGEKKPFSQDKNDFFNSLRKQAELKNGVVHHSDQDSSASSSPMRVCGALAFEEKSVLSASSSSVAGCSALENGNVNDADEDPGAPAGEEKAFLESLGWEENAGETALTPEEIASFFKENEEKLGPDFKYRAGFPESWRSGSCSSGLSLSGSEAGI